MRKLGDVVGRLEVIMSVASRKLSTIQALSLVAMCVGALSFALYFRRREVGLNSGRIRYQSGIAPFVFAERIEDTPFSLILEESTGQGAPHWQLASQESCLQFWQGRASRARSQMDRFARVSTTIDLSRNERVEAARGLLELLREDQLIKADELVDGIEDQFVHESN